MSVGTPLILVVCLTAANAVPVFAQDGSGLASADSEKTDDNFGDEPPVKPPPPPTNRNGTPSAKPPPQARTEVEPKAEAAFEPEVVTAKLAINDAFTRKDAPAAERLYQAALKQFPLDPDFRKVQELRALNLHEEKVRAIFGRASADASRLFGRQWLPGQATGDHETSFVLDVSVRRTDGKANASVDAALIQGYGCISRGDLARADKVLSGAISRHDNYAELYYARVMARGLGGYLKKADEDSLRAVKLSGEHPVALSQRATLMMRMGRREEGFAWANRALEANPRDADALVIRGRVLWLDRKRSDTALADFKKAAEIDPERYQENYEGWSRLFLHTRARESVINGDYKQALTDADAILKGDPSDAQSHTVRGMAFLKMGKVEETIKESTLALKSDPTMKWALRWRAQAMETLGARSKALADLKRAAALDPGRFREDYESLLRAQRMGSPPLWTREGNAGVLADSR